MIGLMVLGALVLWLIIAIFLSKKIPQWFGVIKHKTAISVLLFPLIVVMPIADDLIGMWQFRQLCKREAVVTLSPDWIMAKRARSVSMPSEFYDQYMIPISSTGSKYIDIDRNMVFMTTKAFGTRGGFLRHLGEGQNVCQPKNYQSIQKEISLNELIKNGEVK